MPNWPDIVFWLLAATSTLWAVMQVRQGIVQRGWLVVFATIMAVALVGRFLGQPVVIGVAGALWLVGDPRAVRPGEAARRSCRFAPPRRRLARVFPVHRCGRPHGTGG